jgi:hypothetical protein
MNPAFRQSPLQLGNTGVGYSHVKFPEVGQPFEILQASIVNLGTDQT